MRLATRHVDQAEERVNFLREQIAKYDGTPFDVHEATQLLETFGSILDAMRLGLALAQGIVRETTPHPKGAAAIDAS